MTSLQFFHPREKHHMEGGELFIRQLVPRAESLGADWRRQKQKCSFFGTTAPRTPKQAKLLLTVWAIEMGAGNSQSKWPSWY